MIDEMTRMQQQYAALATTLQEQLPSATSEDQVRVCACVCVCSCVGLLRGADVHLLLVCLVYKPYKHARGLHGVVRL